MKIWVISDTHTNHRDLIMPDLSDVDMIIHAGDCGAHPNIIISQGDIKDFLKWFAELPVKHKLYIPGNHDTSVDKGLWTVEEVAEYGITMLIDETITIDDIKIFGCPHTPRFGQGWAFNKERGADIAQYWELIEEGTDIVVSHGPPFEILDFSRSGHHCGCVDLGIKILEIKPKYHIFGHIHEDGGKIETKNDITYINASTVNLRHEIVNHGRIIEI